MIIAIAVVICVAILASTFVLLNGDFIGTNNSHALENNSSNVTNDDLNNQNNTETQKTWKKKLIHTLEQV